MPLRGLILYPVARFRFPFPFPFFLFIIAPQAPTVGTIINRPDLSAKASRPCDGAARRQMFSASCGLPVSCLRLPAARPLSAQRKISLPLKAEISLSRKAGEYRFRRNGGISLYNARLAAPPPSFASLPPQAVHLSPVTCHLTTVTCQLSPVSCQLSSGTVLYAFVRPPPFSAFSSSATFLRQ